MPRKKNREVEVFSMSFLDCICCGFGAVILIFVITTGRGLRQDEGRVAAASRDIKTLEAQIEETRAGLTQDRETLSSLIAANQVADAQQQEALKIQEQIQDQQAQLAEAKAALELAIEENAKTEIAPVSPPSPSSPKTPVKAAPVKQVQPLYLTEFSLEGKRVLILIEASGGMLGNSVNEALSYLKRPKPEREQSPKWKRVQRALSTLMAYLPEQAQVQVAFFNDDVRYLGVSPGPQWKAVTDAEFRKRVNLEAREYQPAGGANLERAFRYVAGQQPDNIILLVDGLPTLSEKYQAPPQATETHRLLMMRAAMDQFPRGSRLNVLLFPMAGDPGAAAHYWKYAATYKGSMITPAASWPE